VICVPPSTRIFVATEPTDMRKSFEGLGSIARQILKQDPLSGHLFLFTNRSRNRLKVLFWDGSGLWVMAKRLEKGTFSWPIAEAKEGCCTLQSEELAALIGGLDLTVAKQRKWYRRTPTSA
jgi:transposase